MLQPYTQILIPLPLRPRAQRAIFLPLNYIYKPNLLEPSFIMLGICPGAAGFCCCLNDECVPLCEGGVCWRRVEKLEGKDRITEFQIASWGEGIEGALENCFWVFEARD